VLASIEQTMSVAMSSSLRGHEGSQQRHEAAVRIVDKLGVLFVERDENGDGVLDAQACRSFCIYFI